MKKIIFLLLFVNIAFTNVPLIGNDFLSEYPFDKRIDQMTETERNNYNYYNGYLEGWVGGNQQNLIRMTGKDNQESMNPEQMVVSLKKYLDENPSKRYRELYLLIGDLLSK